MRRTLSWAAAVTILLAVTACTGGSNNGPPPSSIASPAASSAPASASSACSPTSQAGGPLNVCDAANLASAALNGRLANFPVAQTKVTQVWHDLDQTFVAATFNGAQPITPWTTFQQAVDFASSLRQTLGSQPPVMVFANPELSDLKAPMMIRPATSKLHYLLTANDQAQLQAWHGPGGDSVSLLGFTSNADHTSPGQPATVTILAGVAGWSSQLISESAANQAAPAALFANFAPGTEACQATATVTLKPAQSTKSGIVLDQTWDIVGQEVWCNSVGVAFGAAKAGWAYQQYLTLLFHNGQLSALTLPNGLRVSSVVVPQAIYNQVLAQVPHGTT